ncbi:MAG: DUF6378 domain-containing protein [Paraprevotella sp.]|nr:DUF6378 domain-containing protein [Paraprevotella sp.]
MSNANDRMIQALDTAKSLVTGNRQEDYGTPEENFGMIARLWSGYLDHEITAEQVAVLMSLLKIARLANGKKTDDTYYDLLGYGAIAFALRGVSNA